MRSDILIALVLTALFGGYYLVADALPTSLMDTTVTSADTPRLIAIAGMGLSILLIVQAAMKRWLQKTETLSSAGTAPADDGTVEGSHVRAFGILAIGAGFVAVLPYLGYVLSLALLFAAVAAFRGGRMSWNIAAFAVVAAIAFHLIFVVLLNVRMPAGVLAPLLG